jgi:CubicO group peptidase (beta-lactamase class C family)
MDGAQVDGGFDAAALAQVRPALQAIVDQGALSGVVTLVWRRGETVLTDAIGLRDIEAGAPMQRDTLFRIASMTKPVTSAAVMMLIEEGKLALHDPIVRWLPEFADMRVMKDPSGAVDDTYPSPRDITVEDLMTHRAGLSYAFSAAGPIAHAYEAALGPPLGHPHTPDSWLKALGGLPLLYPPGERLHYSHATEVLGYLLARIDGKTLGQSLKDRIFTPLGMADTDFWCPPEKRNRMAKLYRAPADGGALVDVSLSHGDAPPAFEAGGGGLISTAYDFMKFARLLLGQGEVDGVRLLKPESVDAMAANRLTEAQRAIPFLNLPMWHSLGFGLGLSVVMDAEKHQWMGAGSEGAFGWPGAFGTWWQADPAQDMALVYLVQDSMPLGPEAVTQMATAARPTGRLALPVFQKMIYGALKG